MPKTTQPKAKQAIHQIWQAETKIKAEKARWHSTASDKNLDHCRDKIQIYECDLNDLSSILWVMRDVKHDLIFHLASHVNVLTSYKTPLSVINNNVTITGNLLEAIRLSDFDPLVQLCSTSEVYGQVDPKNVPIKEDCPLNPTRPPYAVSKVVRTCWASPITEATA